MADSEDHAAAAVRDSAAQSRSRSPSPPRSPKPKKHKSSGGFRWKEKPTPRDSSDNADIQYNRSSNGDQGRLERGYRDRSPRRDSYRDRGRREDERDGYSGGTGRRWDDSRGYERRSDDRDYRGRDDDRSYDRRDRERRDDRWRDGYRDEERARRRERDANEDERGARKEKSDGAEGAEKRKEKKRKADVVPMSTEPMIIVNVNDRLGTKAAIPCLASDSIKAFKAVVAAHIGRQPHEIMLKRQGERPFKDQLSLADYGVSNGVQLDLELDTGD